jgi:hypothetical protein
MIIDDAFAAFFESSRTKVDQQAQRQMQQPQVSKQLFAVYRRQILNRFQFHKQAIRYQQIHSKPIIEPHPAVFKLDHLLPFNLQPFIQKYPAKNRLIDRLKQNSFPEAILEHWADREIVHRKWKLGPCKVCKKPSFVDGFSLRKIPKCQHCGRNLQLHSRTEIAYTMAPSVRHALSEGFSTVMLAGNFLRNQTKRGFFWLPGVKYAKNGIEGDIDILACCDGGLVFGECKRLSNTPHDAKAWKRTVGKRPTNPFLSGSVVWIPVSSGFPIPPDEVVHEQVGAVVA